MWTDKKTEAPGDTISKKGADWRFLLRNPSPAKSACFTSGILAEAVKSISIDVVDTNTYITSSDCDLAVGANPDEYTLHAIWTSLQSGGCSYIEWSIHPLQYFDNIRKKLREIGFEDIKLYFLQINEDNPQLVTYIPLDSIPALEYFIIRDLRHKTNNTFKQFIKAIRRLIWMKCSRILMSYPIALSTKWDKIKICSVSYKPDVRAKSSITSSISQSFSSIADITSAKFCLLELIEKTVPAYIECVEPLCIGENISIALHSQETSTNQVILFVFADSYQRPFMVVKVSRTKETFATLISESNNLLAIQERFEKFSGIPQILFSVRDNDFVAIGESYIAGAPISTYLNKANYRELCLKVTSWILNFAEKTKTPTTRDSLDNIIKPIECDVDQLFSVLSDTNSADQVKKILDNFVPLFLVCEHGDFGPWNIHLTPNGELGVIDWEGMRISGLPATDLIYFLTNINFFLEGTWRTCRFIESYGNMLDSSTFSGEIFQECLGLYALKMGLSSHEMSIYRLITWLIQTHPEWQHAMGVMEEQSASNHIKEHLFHILLKEELKNHLNTSDTSTD